MKNEYPKVGEICPPCENAPKIEENPQKSSDLPEKMQAAAPDAAQEPAAGMPGGIPAETRCAEPAAKNPPPDAAPPVMQRKEEPASRLDAVFAGVFFVVAWLFWRMQNSLGQPWFYNRGMTQNIGVFWFTLIFVSVVLCWLYRSGHRPAGESWFWLCILIALGGAFALPYGGDLLGAVHYLALLAAASYWVLSASGRLISGEKSSNFLFFDVLHMTFVLPWCNFGRLFAIVHSWFRQCRSRRAQQKKQGQAKKSGGFGAALAGLGVAAMFLMIVMPQLFLADAGFEALWDSMFAGIAAWLNRWLLTDWLETVLVQLVFTIPTAMYLYGLVYGCIHGRYLEHTDSIQDPQIAQGLRIVPRITANIALAVLCGVYAVFLAVQANYLFHAFFGTLPQGFSYAEYARSGFFELCRVAAVNLCILLGANSLCRTPRSENKALRRLNILLSALTLLLLTTAAAKMGLYIYAYGLTEKRVLVSVFLIWLAAVFTAVIVMQLRRVELVRFAVILGAVMFTLLCLLPVGRGIQAYNDFFCKNEPVLTEPYEYSGDYA